MPESQNHIPQEDAPYASVDPFAIADDDNIAPDEEDQTVETKLIQEIKKYLKEAEAEHNTFDIIDLTEQAKMTPTQQIAVHKSVVAHLRNIRNMINDKVKEH